MTKTAVITGASSGIGANAATRLAATGWDVAVVGRNPERTKAVAENIGATAFLADYDKLDEVRALAESLADRYERIDVLANNAGGLIHERGLSADGYERTLQHNHLAPFLLTNLLMPQLKDARIIGTASVANLLGKLRIDDLQWTKRPWFGGWQAYGTSKIETILFTQSLVVRGFEAYAFHPGVVATRFGESSPMMKFIKVISNNNAGISPQQGATPLVHLATVDSVDVPNGTYFEGLKPFGRVHSSAKKPGIAEELWAASAALVSL